MYLLYLDDSGSVDNRNEEYFVLGGVCVHESQVQRLTAELDGIADRHAPGGGKDVEFHASEMYSGRTPPWKLLKDPKQRRDAIKEVLTVVAQTSEPARAFAVAVRKSYDAATSPIDFAFTSVCLMFSSFLERQAKNDYGMIILDESTHATKMVESAGNFRNWAVSTNREQFIIEAPLFVSSRDFRCIQLADHVAYATFRRYEHNDATYFDVFAHRFDRDGAKIWGLRHATKEAAFCVCPSCLTRASNDTDDI